MHEETEFPEISEIVQYQHVNPFIPAIVTSIHDPISCIQHLSFTVSASNRKRQSNFSIPTLPKWWYGAVVCSMLFWVCHESNTRSTRSLATRTNAGWAAKMAFKGRVGLIQ